MTRFDDEVASAAEVTHVHRAPNPVPAATHRDVTAGVNRHTEPALATLSTLEHPDDGVNTAGSVGSSWAVRFDEGLTRVSTAKAAKPFRALGGFFAMALDTFVLIPRRPFAWREFLLQCWFVARVSLLPTMLLAIPLDVLLIFTFNILIMDFGAADYSGTGAAWGTVTQVGPVVTVLVVSGAGATAMCADLGARTIREELDALRVMGVNPIQALVVPRVLAATVVATLLSSVVILVGLIGCFIFSVYVQNVTPGAFVASLTTITHAADLTVAWVKAAVFGLSAGLIACYKGISVGGGPAGVGIAVNETVVFTFVALFAINIVATAIGVKVTI
jgi:phospholipid/cholesterol/gamma-HCH transport system permease protein